MRTEQPTPFGRQAISLIAGSAFIVVPFIFLEAVSAGTSLARFPFALFVAMFLLAVSFSAIAAPLAGRVLRGERSLTLGSVLVRVVLLFVSLVLDQLPCFLGVPNCD